MFQHAQQAVALEDALSEARDAHVGQSSSSSLDFLAADLLQLTCFPRCIRPGHGGLIVYWLV